MRFARLITAAFAATVAAAAVTGCANTATDNQRTAGQFVDDAALTARVKTALARQAGVREAADMGVTTYQGTVQLSGFVESRDQVELAGRVARSVPGVRSVENDLKVVAGGQRQNDSIGASGGDMRPRQ